MDYIEVKAKTIDDAITDALVQLGITSDQLDYEVIEKGSAGILGLGRKDAVIKARKKVVVPEKKAEPVSEKKKAAPSPKKEKAEIVKEEKAVVNEKAPVTIDYSALEITVQDFLTQVFAAMKCFFLDGPGARRNHDALDGAAPEPAPPDARGLAFAAARGL